MKNLNFIILIAFLYSCQVEKTSNPNHTNYLNIEDFGAIGDGKTINSKAIQKAIDQASEEGKIVYVPAGTFMTGTLILKSNTTLEVSKKGIIKGSPHSGDYILVPKIIAGGVRKIHNLIYANGAENITIQGEGTIDGNCYAFWSPSASVPGWIEHKLDSTGDHLYANMVELIEVQNLVIKDILLINSPEWTCHLFNCTDVRVDGLKIRNNLYGPNADGLDMSGVQNVVVSNCNIKTCDDAICLKTFKNSRITKNVVITNCILETSCAAFKMGETYKDIRDVTFSNSVIRNSSRAIGLYATYKGTLENINISNIICNTNAPLVLNRPIQLAAWPRTRPNGEKLPGGNIRNLTIENFTCTTEGRILITAEENLTIENITLKNIKLSYPYIEDATRYADKATSNQFGGISKETRRQNAAIIVQNVKNFEIDGLQISWPKDSIPSEWKHPKRIENGNMNEHVGFYDQLGPEGFSIFYGADVKNSIIEVNNATAWGNAKKYVLVNSDVKIIENK